MLACSTLCIALPSFHRAPSPEYYLQLSELAKARTTAERALSTINFREEQVCCITPETIASFGTFDLYPPSLSVDVQEKLNIWTAYMNLEALYGDSASLGRVFARAQAAADPEAVHFALLGVYARAGEVRRTEADALYRIAAKKFGRTSLRVWHHWAAALFRGGEAASARALLQKALSVLPKPQHVQLVEQFALLEYRFAAAAAPSAGLSADGALGKGAGSGSQERGRTMFEGLVAAMPGRLDLWNVYIDQEIAAFARHGGSGTAAAPSGSRGSARDAVSVRATDLSAVRRLFDRASSLHLNTKKMK
jgi:rRNA biogenesis protein RRP5